MNTKKVAFCWASGEIRIGDKTPKGALPIASGRPDKLLAAIKSTARLAADNVTALVPGIPEAKDQTEGVDALIKYKNRVQRILNEEAA